MSRSTFDELRLPLALSLVVLVAVLVFLPRGADEPADTDPQPTPSVIVGEPGGGLSDPWSPTPSESAAASPSVEVTAAPTPDQTEAPTTAPTPPATPSPSPEPTQPPPAPDGFTAEVLACRSISGSTCNDELRNMPPNINSFTALVRFTDANVGDVINVILDGPGGTIEGGAYALQGSGRGYYYSTFSAAGLPAGSYTLRATRNGSEVAVTGFRRVGP